MSKREIAKCTFPMKVKGGTLVIEQLGRLVCPTQGDSKRKAKKYHTEKVRRGIRNGENREVQIGAGRCREVQGRPVKRVQRVAPLCHEGHVVVLSYLNKYLNKYPYAPLRSYALPPPPTYARSSPLLSFSTFPTFPTMKFTFPVGFTTRRPYFDVDDPSIKVHYRSTVMDGGDKKGPIFIVRKEAAEGHPPEHARTYQGATPHAPWAEILKVRLSSLVSRLSSLVSRLTSLSFVHFSLQLYHGIS